jgi:hypothetical protein
MKDLFQRRKSADAAWIAKPVAPRLTLAAFGKHPGWDDHILGIGIETETLAAVKQAIYVSGIGGQVDSGAWEELAPEKRIPGYDHTFLWLRPGHVILGLLWSSTDSKGRAKYPMVLCVDGEGAAPAVMLMHFLPGLEHLREACKATTSADQVTKDCRAAQDQLRTIPGGASPRPVEEAVSPEARRRFLERPELGPDRLGLLRVLHELGPADAHSRHLRLPLASDSRTEALLLWGGFFRCAVPEAVPLLLITRAGVNWMDVIVGEPASDDFFCLQASNKAMPLATEIPYELPSGLRPRCQALEANYLGAPATATAGEPARDTKAEPPRAPAKPESSAPGSTRSKSGTSLFILGGALLLVAAGAVWLSGRHRGPGEPQAPLASLSNKAILQSQVANQRRVAEEFQKALAAAESAEQSGSLTNALALYQTAQKLKPDDVQVAAKLRELTAKLSDAAAQEQKYQDAIAAARAAWQHKSNEVVIAQADIALAVKPNDPAASKLKSDAQAEQERLAAAAAQDKRYQDAMDRARAAWQHKSNEVVIAQADIALAIKPNDPAAGKLKSDAQAEQRRLAAAAAEDKKYQDAMDRARAAWQNKSNEVVVAQADIALGIKPNDPAAGKLKSEAQAEQKKLADAATQEKEYQGAIGAAQAAWQQKNYDLVVTQADFALGIKPNDPAASKLKSDAQAQASKVKAETEVKSVGKGSEQETAKKLDAEFEKYLVWFRVWKPTDPRIRTEAARKEKPMDGYLTTEAKQWYLRRVDYLDAQYKKAGRLNQDDRKQALSALREAIQLR